MGTETKKSHTHIPKKEFLEIEIIPYLESLRTMLVDICQAYMGKQDSRIVYLLDALGGKHLDGDTPLNVKRTQIKSMRKAFGKLKLKPYKGRRRDMKRVENLLEELEKILGV